MQEFNGVKVALSKETVQKASPPFAVDNREFSVVLQSYIDRLGNAAVLLQKYFLLEWVFSNYEETSDLFAVFKIDQQVEKMVKLNEDVCGNGNGECWRQLIQKFVTTDNVDEKIESYIPDDKSSRSEKRLVVGKQKYRGVRHETHDIVRTLLQHLVA